MLIYFLILAFNSSALKREQDRKIREKEVKKRRIESSCVSNQAGTSSQSTNRQKKKAEHVERGEIQLTDHQSVFLSKVV